jgi:hypothetical protein
MNPENIQLAEVETKNKPSESSPLLEVFLAGMVTACRGPEAAQNDKKIETLPTEKMAPVGTKYNPANPPEPQHQIEKTQIKERQLGNGSSGFTFTVEGKAVGDNDTECQVIYDWKSDKIQPDELILKRIETNYQNTGAAADQAGKDITFIDANGSVGKNTKSVKRFPTHDIHRDGYNCEIKSYPTRDSNGDYLVSLTRSFVSAEGTIEKATEEKIGDKNYEHTYSTSVQRYAGQAVDGTPLGLKSVAFYADEDGGTTRKTMQINYVDGNGKRTVDGKPFSTEIYDASKPGDVKLSTTEHAQFNGATVISKITEHNYLAPGYNYITEVNLADQQWKTRTYQGPDGKPIHKMERNLTDGTIRLDTNRTFNLGPGVPKGSGTIIFKLDGNQQYYIDSLEIRNGSNQLVSKVEAPGLKFVYDSHNQITGLAGAKFYKQGQEIAPQFLANLFNDTGPEATKVKNAWQDVINLVNPQK